MNINKILVMEKTKNNKELTNEIPLKDKFKFIDKISKKNISIYNGKKTLFDKKIELNDKVMEVVIVNAKHLSENQILSVTFKYISEKELNKIYKEYSVLRINHRYPALVEKKFLRDKRYSTIKKLIEEEYSN